MFRLVDDAGRLHSFTGFQVHEPEGRTGPLLYEVVHSYSRREARATRCSPGCWCAWAYPSSSAGSGASGG